MSHEILYGRQFVRTTHGYIPMVLAGASNCTMPNWTGKEIMERQWFSICRDSVVNATEAELLGYAEALYKGDLDRDLCRTSSGKWMTGANMIQFYKNGIKNAKSLEELNLLRPYTSLCCKIATYNPQDGYKEYLSMTTYCRTTDALEKWLDKAKALCASNGGHLDFSFSGHKPLRTEAAKFGTGKPVIVKYGRSYLTEVSESQACFSRKAEDALVFTSIEVACANPAVRKWLHRNENSKQMQFVPVSTNRKLPKEKNFCLKVTGGRHSGLYIQKLSPRSIVFTWSKNSGPKAFASEKEAIKWAEKYGICERCKAAISNVEVEKIKEEV